MQLLVADAERHDLARAWAEALGCAHDLPLGPVPLVAADAENQVSPVAHGDVPSLAVDVEVARDPARRDGQVPAVSNFSSSSPWSTTDWSRFSVPTVLAMIVSYGRCQDSPTWACAPRWKKYGRSSTCSRSLTR